MVKDEDNKDALRALQSLIVKARSMAYEKEAYAIIADILDNIERLCCMIYDKEDKTITFRKYIEKIAEKYNCYYVLNKLDNIPSDVRN